MARMLGLNPDEVRGLAQQFETQASTLDQVMNTLDGLVNQHIPTNWNGNDANRFASDWSGQLRTALTTVATNLRDTATAAHANIRQQEEASA